MTFCTQLNKDQPVTVHSVLQILRLHVSVPQCDVFGYLSIDHQLVVLFAPIDQHPTPMQVALTHTHIGVELGLLTAGEHEYSCHHKVNEWEDTQLFHFTTVFIIFLTISAETKMATPFCSFSAQKNCEIVIKALSLAKLKGCSPKQQLFAEKKKKKICGF